MFKAEFTTSGDRGSYATNGLIFDSRAEAENYAASLAYRWTAVTDWRIREATAEEEARDSLADGSGSRKIQIADPPAEAQNENCVHPNGGEQTDTGWTCDECGTHIPYGTVVEGQKG